MTLPIRLRRRALCLLLALFAASPAHALPAAGDVPPPDLGSNADGDYVRLTAFTGKAVVLTFWATWCPYCLKELPVLENVQNKAGKDRLQVIAVNTESRDVFKRVARILRKSLTLELVSDSSEQAANAYGATSLPYMVIIGRDGHIVRIYKGYAPEQLDDIVADINRALAPLP